MFLHFWVCLIDNKFNVELIIRSGSVVKSHLWWLSFYRTLFQPIIIMVNRQLSEKNEEIEVAKPRKGGGEEFLKGWFRKVGGSCVSAEAMRGGLDLPALMTHWLPWVKPYQALQERHPPSHPNSLIPSMDEESHNHAIAVDEEEVIAGIRSFGKDSAVGPDWLRSQHLKYIISVECAWSPSITSCSDSLVLYRG